MYHRPSREYPVEVSRATVEADERDRREIHGRSETHDGYSLKVDVPSVVS